MSEPERPDPLCKRGQGRTNERESQRRAKLNQVILDSLPGTHPSKLTRKVY